MIGRIKPATLLKRDSGKGEFCEISNNTFYYKTPIVAASACFCFVLVHYTRSNLSRFKDGRFIHKLYLSLHAINRLTEAYSLHRIEKLKDFTELFKSGLILFP